MGKHLGQSNVINSSGDDSSYFSGLKRTKDDEDTQGRSLARSNVLGSSKGDDSTYFAGLKSTMDYDEDDSEEEMEDSSEEEVAPLKRSRPGNILKQSLTVATAPVQAPTVRFSKSNYTQLTKF